MINKHKVIKEFIDSFLTVKNLVFESFEMYPGARSIVPNYGDYMLKQDIIGNKYMVYTFTFIACERTVSIPNAEENMANMLIMDEFNQWILEQERNRRYPDFGESCSGYKWELTQNMGNLAFIDGEGVGKYMLTVKLHYIEGE